jgi:hypothetical protein
LPGAVGVSSGCEFVAVNPTETPATLTVAELHLSYEGGPVGDILTIRLPVAEKIDSIPEQLMVMMLPKALPGNGAAEGWLVFGFDRHLIGSRPIRGYDVVVSDSRGISASVQPWVMREHTI